MTMAVGFLYWRPVAAVRLTDFPYRLLVLSCAAIDAALVGRCVTGAIGPATTLGGHLGAAVLLCAVFALLLRRVEAQLCLLLAVLVLCGPLGSFVILLGGLDGADRATPAQDLLTQPRQTDRPSSVADAVYDAIRQGRRPRRAVGALRNLELTFLHGDLAQQQRALSAISRFYQPQMLAALRLALMSKRPALRVQAAAVYAKLRGTFGERAKLLMRNLSTDQDMTTQEQAAHFAECRAVAASGFIHPTLAAQLLSMTTEPGTGAVLMPRPGPAAPARRVPRRHQVHGLDTKPPPLKRYTCGGIA